MDETFKDLVLSSDKLSQDEKDEFLRRLLEQQNKEARKIIFVHDYVFGNPRILGWSEITLDNIYLEKELKDIYTKCTHSIFKIKGCKLPDDISRWTFDVVMYDDGAMSLYVYRNEDILWKK